MTLEQSVQLREWILVLPAMFVLLAPGFGPAYRFAVRARLSWPWVIMLSFAWSVAWGAMVAIAAFYLGLHFDVVLVLYVLTVPLSGYLAYDAWSRQHEVRRRRAEEGRPLKPMRPCWGGLGLAFAALVGAMIQEPWWFGTADSFFHIGASRSLLATGRPIVTDPIFGTASKVPDSTAGMWNTMQAVLARLFDVDVATVYPALTGIAAFLVVLAFWTLAFEIGHSRSAATWASAGYAVFAWYADFRTFGYPNRISIALALAAIALLVRLVTRPDRRFVYASAVTTFATLAVHLASGELVLLSGGAIVLAVTVLAFSRTDAAERRRARDGVLAVIAALGLAVMLELPTLYPRVTALKGSTVLGEDSFVWAGTQIVEGSWGLRWVVPGGFDFGGPWLFWLTLLGAGLCVWALVKGDTPRTAAALALLLVAPVIGSFPPVSTPILNFSSYMVARMIELYRFAPYVAVAWALGSVPSRWKRPARMLAVAILIAATVTQWPYLLSTYVQDAGLQRRGHKFSIASTQNNDVRKSFGFQSIFDIRQLLGQSYPLVAADPTTGYYFQGLVPCATVASLPTHSPVFMSKEELDTRFTEMIWFFNEHADNVFRRAIFEKYGVEYVFVWKVFNGNIVMREIRSMPELDVAYENDSVVLFRVRERHEWPDPPATNDEAATPGTDGDVSVSVEDSSTVESGSTP